MEVKDIDFAPTPFCSSDLSKLDIMGRNILSAASGFSRSANLSSFVGKRRDFDAGRCLTLNIFTEVKDIDFAPAPFCRSDLSKADVMGRNIQSAASGFPGLFTCRFSSENDEILTPGGV